MLNPETMKALMGERDRVQMDGEISVHLDGVMPTEVIDMGMVFGEEEVEEEVEVKVEVEGVVERPSMDLFKAIFEDSEEEEEILEVVKKVAAVGPLPPPLSSTPPIPIVAPVELKPIAKAMPAEVVKFIPKVLVAPKPVTPQPILSKPVISKPMISQTPKAGPILAAAYFSAPVHQAPVAITPPIFTIPTASEPFRPVFQTGPKRVSNVRKKKVKAHVIVRDEEDETGVRKSAADFM